jgi:ankyrin repeat protein
VNDRRDEPVSRFRVDVEGQCLIWPWRVPPPVTNASQLEARFLNVRWLKTVSVEMDNAQLFIALLDASRHGDVDRVRTLLDIGADVNAQDILDGYTPLHYAIAAGSNAVIQLLIDRSADIEHDQNVVYQTPLGTAVLTGNANLVKTLLEAGANPHTTLYPNGQSLVDAAIENGYTDVAGLLLDHQRPKH